ncbi:MAG TPA: hypothetical protein VM265_08010 [Sphingomicrobium sp.]|nr:hypothetical protein [Sphingomicrobium sp.]
MTGAVRLFDHRAAVQPLLDAVPGSSAVSCCGRCGRNIEGLAELTDEGFVVHPDACPDVAGSGAP